MNTFTHLTFIELLRMEREPDIKLRRSAFHEVIRRWRLSSPVNISGTLARIDCHFGIPWVGCDYPA